MPFLITALVGFMVLPASATAPLPSEAQVATTTAATVKVAVASEKAVPALTVKLTGYNALPEQTDSTPFVTASGAYSNPEVVAARSADLAKQLPYGTVIAIERTAEDNPSCNFRKVEHLIGYRVLADGMNPRISNTVDVLLDHTKTVKLNGKEANPARALGLCGNVTVRVIGKIAVKDIPDTQEELAAMIAPVVLAQR